MRCKHLKVPTTFTWEGLPRQTYFRPRPADKTSLGRVYLKLSPDARVFPSHPQPLPLTDPYGTGSGCTSARVGCCTARSALYLRRRCNCYTGCCCHYRRRLHTTAAAAGAAATPSAPVAAADAAAPSVPPAAAATAAAAAGPMSHHTELVLSGTRARDAQPATQTSRAHITAQPGRE